MPRYVEFSDPFSNPGRFPATLTNIDEGDGRYGPYYRFEWTVTAPDGSRRPISELVAVSSSPRSKLARRITALTGEAPTDGDQLDLDSLIGMPAYVILTEKNGFHNISEVEPAIEPRLRMTDMVPF